MAESSRESNEKSAYLQRQALEAELQVARIQTEKARQVEAEIERLAL